MNKTNMNYTAPEMEIISIETQNCFASTGYTISSPSSLGELKEETTDWN